MNGREIVKHFEDCKLEAYLCPAGVPTIGWGHTKGVKLGDKITQDKADSLFEQDYHEAEQQVQEVVTAFLSDQQLGALTSFVFNLGIGQLKVSTLLKKLNQNDYKGAGDEFRKWIYSNGKILPGLVKRREMERMVFLDGI
jgi:lysozyme